MLLLELDKGNARKNLETLMGGTYHGITFETINFKDMIESVDAEFPLNYFEYLQSSMDNYDTDLVDKISIPILKVMRSCEYMLCPIGEDIRGSVLGYTVSWLMSSVLPGSMRGVAYYANKTLINEESVARDLARSFESSFGFEKLITREGDVLYLDLQNKHKGIFKKFE